MDMLWVVANGKNFKEYPRFVDFMDKTKSNRLSSQKNITEQDIINMFKGEH